MPLQSLDHVNVRTANLDAMIAWYRDILGFREGPRPPFSFGGAWMYCGDRPIVHLVAVDHQPGAKEPALEHAAFGATGLAEFLAHLKRQNIDYRPNVVPGFGIVQINLWDPDGNHLHVDFPPEEAKALEGA
jgi:catechol 2,3-dioxygenase-like lactoylglutathione lyase family enzyme